MSGHPSANTQPSRPLGITGQILISFCLLTALFQGTIRADSIIVFNEIMYNPVGTNEVALVKFDLVRPDSSIENQSVIIRIKYKDYDTKKWVTEEEEA